MEAEDVGSERQMTAVWRFGGLAVCGAVFLTGQPLNRLTAQDTTAGKQVYQKWCAGCHGDDGKGDGEGARHMLPTPRCAGLHQDVLDVLCRHHPAAATDQIRQPTEWRQQPRGVEGRPAVL